MNKETKNRFLSLLLFAIVIALFFSGVKPGLIIAVTALAVIVSTERKVMKMFMNFGFILFLLIALGVPVAIDFSLPELLQNIFIVLRGILIFLLIFFYARNFESSVLYRKLKKILPEELIDIIQTSFDILPEIQKKAFGEIRKIKLTPLKPLAPLADFFWVFVEIAERMGGRGVRI